MKPSLADIALYFLRLGAIGFGGPIALVSYMHRDLVEQRGWFTEQQYRDGLALSQLAPGPLAAQLATYLGWVRHGLAGATIAAIAFVAPSLLMVLALSVLYVRFGGLPWMTGAFYGVGAAVIGIIAVGCARLARKTLGTDWLFWLLFAANAVFTAVTAKELLSVLLLSGLVVMAVRAPPRVPGLAVVVPELVIFGFFAKASLVVFGSGLAIVPFLYGGVVEHYHWLNDRQFLDAIAVSMITPGPVVITVAFIGYLVAGASGGLAAAFGMFLPVYVVVIVAAPLYDRIRDNRSMSAFAQGITAAVTGALAGAVIVLGRRAVVDWTTLILCVVTLFLLLQPKFKVPEPIVILIAGTAGVLLAR